jgi:2-polyprenyl-3-methyl-5-hydroxy-6-metoxy-1,4-benzoquinol methylase
MISRKEKIKYLLSSLFKRMKGAKNVCPYCKTDLKNGALVDKKYAVTALLECPQCNILVRVPTDDVAASNEFYQEVYSQEYTTGCPSDEELQKLVARNFAETDRDYSRYIRFFDFLRVSPGARILDFGCSWGYGLHQFRQGGYNAEGFEVSAPRALYGKQKLGLPIYSTVKELKGTYDVIFSSHVLEHLPDFSEINDLYLNHLSNGGLFVAVTPNGSQDFRKANYNSYHQLWGKVHPVLLNEKFVRKNFGKELSYLDSWDSMTPELRKNQIAPILDKWELVYVLKSRA